MGNLPGVAGNVLFFTCVVSGCHPPPPATAAKFTGIWGGCSVDKVLATQVWRDNLMPLQISVKKKKLGTASCT